MNIKPLRYQQSAERRTSPVVGLWAVFAVWFVLAPTAFGDHKGQRGEEKEPGRGSSQTAFFYQGQLKDDGIPSSGAYDLRFTLYTAQTDGDGLGSIIFENKELKNGLFKLPLDFGSAVTDGKSSWLEISVRRSGTTESYTALSPRQRLTPTPYAVFAQQERWSLIGMPVGVVGGADVAKGTELPGDVPTAPGKSDAAIEPGAASPQPQERTTNGKAQPQGPSEAGGWSDDGPVVRLTTGTDRVGIGTLNPGNRKLKVITTANEGAAEFDIDNPSSQLTALTVGTNGSGDALRVRAEGSGRAAHFSTSNSNSTSTVLAVESGQSTGISSFSNSGTAMFGQSFSAIKPAGHFQIFNSNSKASALVAETNGDGAGVTATGKTGVAASGINFGLTGFSSNGSGVFGFSGNGTAGEFTIVGFGASDNTHPALDAATFGRGPAGRFRVLKDTNPSPALDVSTASTDAIKAVTTGTGFAGIFQVNNSESEGAALYATTNGRGPAALIIGRTVTNVLEITGGSDLAERFEISEAARPGMVVAIDPNHPGLLCIARGSYNRRVAGVISGANKLDAGMVLADLPGATDSRPLALSGRVWVDADATSRAINPGDLLTTAARAGYAMKVIDRARAQGAIIGKAMTGLKKGETGLVLVLINLQ